MVAAGQPIIDDELVDYIITSLGPEFESLVSALVTRVELVSVDKLYSQMLTFEMRMGLVHGGDLSSANLARCGGSRGSNPGPWLLTWPWSRFLQQRWSRSGIPRQLQ